MLDNQTVIRNPSWRRWFLVRKLKQLTWLSYFALIFAITLGIWIGVTQSRFFELKTVEVVGNLKELTVEEVIQASKISYGVNLFSISVKAVEQNVLDLPWVLKVSVRRQSPDTLWIYVHEKKVKAMLFADKLYYVSEQGIAFKPTETEKAKDVPVLTGFQRGQSLEKAFELINFFEHNRDLGMFGLSEIHYNQPSGFSIVTLEGPMEIRLGNENLEEKLVRLKKVWAHLKPKAKKVKGFDLNYADRAFVKL